jgi:hypothetical protein
MLDQLNSEDRASTVTIFEEYNDIFHLLNDKLNCSSTNEHSLPAPTVDPHRAIKISRTEYLKYIGTRYRDRKSKC